MTVSEVVTKYHLEDADKTYLDVYGGKHPLPNLHKLISAPVKEFYYNLRTNEAVITVIGIENWDNDK